MILYNNIGNIQESLDRLYAESCVFTGFKYIIHQTANVSENGYQIISEG